MPDSLSVSFETQRMLEVALGAFLGFLLGLVAFRINEYAKRRRERKSLSQLFTNHILDSWIQVDSLQSAPMKPYHSRLLTTILGIRDLAFSGEPEYNFVVDDVALFESHGMRLAQLLRGAKRREFWLCYRLLRKAEAARLALRQIPPDDLDRPQYQKLYRELVIAYGKQMLKLHELLT